jgi:glycosyltransferase involved in cell wall biosynthesis
MKICVYSPYIPKHAGGGEKYILDVAKVLAEQHQVTVAVSSLKPLSAKQQQEIQGRYEAFLNQPLDKITWSHTPLGTSATSSQKLLWTKQFDLMYYATDGSLFFSLAGKNIVHIQIPFTDTKASFMERAKLANWRVRNTNSAFTKQVIESHWHIPVQFVHYPMIEGISPGAHKQPIILHVGRFFRQLHSKRQDVLIKFFATMIERRPRTMAGWKLVLAGGVEDESYAKELKQAAKGLPIEFYHSLSRPELIKLYQQASLYWHATGYEVDEQLHPEKMEHFGISTVEAMAAGCVPVVIDKGGQREIMVKDLANWTWETEEECVSKTLELIENDSLRVQLSLSAQRRASDFSQTAFAATLEQMLKA